MLYNNHYVIFRSLLDICYVIKLLINASIFYKKLRKDSGKSLLLDFFVNKFALLAKEIKLADYISSSQGNWGTKGSSYNISNNNDNLGKCEDNNDTIKRYGKELKNKNHK